MLRYKTKTRPGLVALYDIRPGNGAGPFLVFLTTPEPARGHQDIMNTKLLTCSLCLKNKILLCTFSNYAAQQVYCATACDFIMCVPIFATVPWIQAFVYFNIRQWQIPFKNSCIPVFIRSITEIGLLLITGPTPETFNNISYNAHIPQWFEKYPQTQHESD